MHLLVEVEVPVDKKWIIIAIVPIDRASVTKFKPGTCTLRQVLKN